MSAQLSLFASHGEVATRAAEYFERQHFEDWSDTDQAALEAWMAESALHRVAFLRLKAAAAHSEELFALDALDLKRAAAPATRKRFRYRRFMIPLLAAASIALIAAVGYPFFVSWMQPPDRTYSTEVGGRTLLKFADGTVVDLDTDTAARFRMTNGERTVWLEKGEAWFHVAHDASNPFTVVVGKHRITDLGTEFLIHRSTDGMEVALLNGKASLSTEGAAVAMLTPGEEAVATPVSVSVTRKTPQELADALAWRRGMLVFRNTRLADAVREVNRYSAIKLVIADPAIADLRFNGEVKNDNVEDFLALTQVTMKLRADRQGKDILLSRDAPEKTKRAAHARREP